MTGKGQASPGSGRRPAAPDGLKRQAMSVSLDAVADRGGPGGGGDVVRGECQSADTHRPGRVLGNESGAGRWKGNGLMEGMLEKALTDGIELTSSFPGAGAGYRRGADNGLRLRRWWFVAESAVATSGLFRSGRVGMR